MKIRFEELQNGHIIREISCDAHFLLTGILDMIDQFFGSMPEDVKKCSLCAFVDQICDKHDFDRSEIIDMLIRGGEYNGKE